MDTKKYNWNYTIIGYDTYEGVKGVFKCEILLKPDWWKFWRRNKTIYIIGDEFGWYDVDSGNRVPKEMNDNVISWFRTWKHNWI